MDGMKGGAPEALDETLDNDGNGGADDAEAAPEAARPSAAGDGVGAEGGAAERDEIGALNDRYLRLAAEFDNYRKRTERERAETWSRSQADLAAGLLDVLDDLGRVAHLDPAAATVQSLVEGVQLVERKLLRALEAAGLEEVEAADQPFDPSSMDALMTVPAESPAQDDTVAAVFQKGYRFKGQLLRPARVQVRKHDG